MPDDQRHISETLKWLGFDATAAGDPPGPAARVLWWPAGLAGQEEGAHKAR